MLETKKCHCQLSRIGGASFSPIKMFLVSKPEEGLGNRTYDIFTLSLSLIKIFILLRFVSIIVKGYKRDLIFFCC